MNSIFAGDFKSAKSFQAQFMVTGFKVSAKKDTYSWIYHDKVFRKDPKLFANMLPTNFYIYLGFTASKP